jgi:hypothetical protein
MKKMSSFDIAMDLIKHRLSQLTRPTFEREDVELLIAEVNISRSKAERHEQDVREMARENAAMKKILLEASTALEIARDEIGGLYKINADLRQEIAFMKVAASPQVLHRKDDEAEPPKIPLRMPKAPQLPDWTDPDSTED